MSGTAVAEPQSAVVGLDIGGTKISGVLVDGAGSRVAVERVATRPGPDGVLSSAIECVDALRSSAGLQELRPSAIGVGIAGVVDSALGSVSNAVNLGLGSEPFLLGPSLGVRLGCDVVRLENDVNVAAVGASRLLDMDDVAFLALGTGIAAGIVLEGRLLRGHGGVAGEIGHVPYRAEGPSCPCGQQGCLELFASGAALAAMWPARDGRPAGVELFEAHAAGRPGAGQVRARYADAVAMGVQLLVLTCGVRSVVLGGGVAQIGAPLLDAVVEALEARAAASTFLHSIGLPRRVTLAPAGHDAPAMGAALLATDALTSVVSLAAPV